MKNNNIEQVKKSFEEFFRRLESINGRSMRDIGVSASVSLSKSEEEALVDKKAIDYLLKKGTENIDEKVINRSLTKILGDKLK